MREQAGSTVAAGSFADRIKPGEVAAAAVRTRRGVGEIDYDLDRLSFGACAWSQADDDRENPACASASDPGLVRSAAFEEAASTGRGHSLEQAVAQTRSLA
jgi:hypothetical protein